MHRSSRSVCLSAENVSPTILLFGVSFSAFRYPVVSDDRDRFSICPEACSKTDLLGVHHKITLNSRISYKRLSGFFLDVIT